MNTNYIGKVDPNQIPSLAMENVRQNYVKKEADLRKKGSETKVIPSIQTSFVRRTKALKENPPL